MIGTTRVATAVASGRGTVNLTHIVHPIEPNASVRAAAIERDVAYSDARRKAHSDLRQRDLDDHLRVLHNANEQTRQRLEAVKTNALRIADAADAIVAEAPPVRHPEPNRASHAPFLTGSVRAAQAKATSRQLALQFRKAEGRFTAGPLRRRAGTK
jgi:hypothetical protein